MASTTPNAPSGSTTGTTWSAHLAHVHWATGDWQAAEAQARHALADGQSGITTKITALHVLGYLAFGRDEPAGGHSALAQAAELGGQMRELQRVSPAWWGLAETALHTRPSGRGNRLV